MRTLLTLFLILTGCSLAACTPAQIATLERLQGHTFTDESRSALAQLPDVPIRLPDRSTIELDGSITPPPPYTPFDGAKCPQWHETALQAGWGVEHMERLDHIMWRESRCQPEVHYKADPMTGSRGLAQINGFWCLKNRYEPHPAGYLGARGILNHCNDLFDPLVNLKAAKAIYDYGVERNQCPWRPWSTRSTRWCG